MKIDLEFILCLCMMITILIGIPLAIYIDTESLNEMDNMIIDCIPQKQLKEYCENHHVNNLCIDYIIKHRNYCEVGR